jgi:hypothetical protein
MLQFFSPKRDNSPHGCRATTRVLGNCHVPFRAELADFRELARLPAPTGIVERVESR